MRPELGSQRLLAAVLLVLFSLVPAWSWTMLPSARRTRNNGIARRDSTTCHPTHPTSFASPVLKASTTTTTTMRATASSDDSSSLSSLDAAKPTSSLTRVDWLRVGASLAVIAPVLGVAADGDAASAATPGASVTVLGAGGKTGRECVEYLASRGAGGVGLRSMFGVDLCGCCVGWGGWPAYVYGGFIVVTRYPPPASRYKLFQRSYESTWYVACIPSTRYQLPVCRYSKTYIAA